METILDKVFFFILWRFYLFSVFVSQNLKNSSSERWIFFFWNRSYRVSKNQEFYADFKKQTCLSDKMPPKKVYIKKPFYNFASPIFLHFFIWTFLAGYRH